MKTIEITWKAFGRPTTAIVSYDTALDDLAICAKAFRETNLYGGFLWDTLLAQLPEERTHTALSVGDEVTIDDNTYECVGDGWKKLEVGDHRYCHVCENLLTEWNLAPIGCSDALNRKRVYADGVYLCDDCYDHWCTENDIQPEGFIEPATAVQEDVQTVLNWLPQGFPEADIAYDALNRLAEALGLKPYV